MQWQSGPVELRREGRGGEGGYTSAKCRRVESRREGWGGGEGAAHRRSAPWYKVLQLSQTLWRETQAGGGDEETRGETGNKREAKITGRNSVTATQKLEHRELDAVVWLNYAISGDCQEHAVRTRRTEERVCAASMHSSSQARSHYKAFIFPNDVSACYHEITCHSYPIKCSSLSPSSWSTAPCFWRVNEERWLVCSWQVFSQRYCQHPLLFEEDKYIGFMAPLWMKQTKNFILVNSLMDWSVQFWKATDGTNERHWRTKQILKQCMTSRVMTQCLEGFLFWCGLLGAAKKTMVWQKADKTADISCYWRPCSADRNSFSLP